MRLRPRGHTPVPERNDNRAGERGEEANDRRKPWGLRGTSVTSVMCWTSERPRSFRPSCRSTSARRSRSGRTTCSAQPASTCPRRPSATTWRCSSRRATSTSPTRARAGCPPTRATGSSSIRSPGRARSTPAARCRCGRSSRTAHGALEQMLLDTSQLLTRLTDHAAVVVGAPLEQATIRSRAARRAVVTGRAGRHRALERRRRAPDHRARRRARGRPDRRRVVPPRASDGRDHRERSCGRSRPPVMPRSTG